MEDKPIDVHGVERRIQSVTANLKKDKEISETNKKLIFDFVDDLQTVKKIKTLRAVKCFYTLKQIALWLKKDFKDATTDDIKKRVVKVMESEEYSANSIHDYNVSLKQFYRWLFKMKKGQYPECVEWIVVKKEKPAPPRFLFEEDIVKLVSGAENIRDKALIMTLYESGGRISEVLNLRVKDVNFNTKPTHLTFFVSKTEKRTVPIYAAEKYLIELLNSHPLKDSSKNFNDNPIFVCKEYGNAKEYSYAPLKYGAVYQMLRDLKKRTNLKKPLSPHILRKSRATFLASRPEMNEALLCKFFGWRLGSPVARHYVDISGKALDDALKGIFGEAVPKEVKESLFKVKKCWRCEADLTPDIRFCPSCGASVELSYVEEMTAEIQKSALLEDKSIRAFFVKMLNDQKAIQDKLFGLEQKLKMQEKQLA